MAKFKNKKEAKKKAEKVELSAETQRLVAEGDAIRAKLTGGSSEKAKKDAKAAEKKSSDTKKPAAKSESKASEESHKASAQVQQEIAAVNKAPESQEPPRVS